MSTDNTYWETRVPSRRSFRYYLKNDTLISGVLNLRAGAESFLKRELARIRTDIGQEKVRVLDIACGWGVSFATNENVDFYGVDIEGFPKQLSLENGYIDAREYGKDLDIPFDDGSFDAAMIMNLNAHIPSDLYSRLLRQARRKLKPSGKLLIIAETDNNGLSYSMMKKISRWRFDRMVAGMDHSNFVFEQEFDRFLAHEGVEIERKKTIIGNILPFLHYTAWAANKSPEDALRYPAFAIDVVNSLFDGVLTAAGLGGQGRRFDVGYVCRFKS